MSMVDRAIDIGHIPTGQPGHNEPSHIMPSRMRHCRDQLGIAIRPEAALSDVLAHATVKHRVTEHGVQRMQKPRAFRVMNPSVVRVAEYALLPFEPLAGEVGGRGPLPERPL